MISILDNPPLTEALRQWRGREVFVSDLSSAQIRGFSRDLRMRSVFSARTTNAEYLNEVASVVDDMLSGKINMATGRLRLFRKLKQLGYDPAVGFPADMATIPPAEKDSLQDLSSEARLNLVLETNMRIAANYGRMVEGNSPYALHAYPAWELVRLYIRSVPRGTPESHSAGWTARWNDAGESVGWVGVLKPESGNRKPEREESRAERGSRPLTAPLSSLPSPTSGLMIARKDSPIWQALGDGAGGHEDTLSNPFPPFAFNSGMAWKAVDRARCLSLALVAPAESSGAMDGELTPGEQEVNDIFDRMAADLQEELRRELAA